MKYYIEITLIENNQLTFYQLWSRLYTQLHLAFVEHKDNQGQILFGVSFPQYRYNPDKKMGILGGKVRIFAETESLLISLDLNQWLINLRDMLHWTSIRPVPTQIKYAIYQRRQFKTSAESLAKHRLKQRHDMTFEQAVAYYTPRLKTSYLPYIQLKSLTNKQGFKLFIEKREVTEIKSGTFSCYGLSPIISVPDF